MNAQEVKFRVLLHRMELKSLTEDLSQQSQYSNKKNYQKLKNQQDPSIKQRQ